MPPYVASPEIQNTPVVMLIPGQPAYAYGTKSTNKPTMRFTVQRTFGDGTTATINVTTFEGFLPVPAGSVISVAGTTRGSGGFNVRNAAVTASSIDPTTGIGTISYTCSAAAVAGNDPGEAIIPSLVIPEAAGVSTSQQFGIQNTIGRGYGISWGFDADGPSAISVQLEGAIVDEDDEYAIIGTAQTGSGEFVAQVPNLVNFVRLRTNSLTGTGTISGRILLS